MDLSDDSDDSSSPETLESFREKWKNELAVKKKNENEKHRNFVNNVNQEDVSDEKKAEKFFLEAAELERKGKVFEAMRLYRRAVQLDANIEFKIYEKTKNNLNNNTGSQTASDTRARRKNSIVNDDEEDLSDVDLIERFQTSIANGNGALFERENAGKGVIVTGGFHVSNLPMEIILIILKWVVSSHLDMRSLEQCAMVSKGFYLCTRDTEIWKLACKK